MAITATATGNDHAQFPSQETAAAPARHPAKNPISAPSVLFKSAFAPFIRGSPREKLSSSDRTRLVVFPVITAVEGAPGTVRRKSANWDVIAETANIGAMIPMTC